MTLSQGSALGPYSIDSEIGRGGMGVVYRARDSRLGRDVAIKALPEVFLADEARLSRFQREAKTLASLNHGNIAQIYGLEEQDSHQFLVLEYVEGETLGERLDRGQLAIDEALIICAGIATGVEAAHEADVVHRDLKPGNIKITPGGEVKVLDFGLAKSGTSPSKASSEVKTITKPDDSVTAAGLVLGTPAYMSPEQARGKELDKRTDIWAFGVVLYECLTGLKPFAGETATDSIAAILERDPDFDALPNRTPPAVRALLKHCLEKDANRRLRDIGDARILLDDAVATRAWTTTAIQAAHGQIRARSRRTSTLWAASLLLVFGATLGGASWILPKSVDPSVLKIRVPLAVPGSFLHDSEISPDGTAVAYVLPDSDGDSGGVYLQRLDELEPRVLVEEQSLGSLNWSSNSRWIAYREAGRIHKIPPAGGSPTPVGTLPSRMSISDWGDDGLIYAAVGPRGRTRQILAFPENSGEPISIHDFEEPVETVPGLCVLPNGAGVVRVDRGPTFKLTLSDGAEEVTLLELNDEIGPLGYSPTGHILYSQGGVTTGIWALPFSLSEGEPTGQPFLVAPGGWDPSVSKDGTLVYNVGSWRRSTGRNVSLVWVDRGGVEISRLGRVQQFISDPELSPDGRRVVTVSNDAGEGMDLWVHETNRRVANRATSDEDTENYPQWVGDRGDLVYSSSGSEPFTISRLNVDSVEPAETLTEGRQLSVAPDGSSMIFVRGFDLWRMDLDGSTEPEAFLSTAARERRPRISPDGNFVAYESDETNSFAIYLTRYPSGEGKTQVVENVGPQWRWGKDSKRIFYLANDQFHEVEVDLSGEWPEVGTSRVLFNVGPGLFLRGGFDISEDGERFLVAKAENAEEEAPDSEIIVVVNWFEEFRDRQDRRP